MAYWEGGKSWRQPAARDSIDERCGNSGSSSNIDIDRFPFITYQVGNVGNLDSVLNDFDPPATVPLLELDAINEQEDNEQERKKERKKRL